MIDRRVVIAVVVLAVGIVGYGIVHGRLTSALPECPHDWSGSMPAGNIPAHGLSIPGPLTNVPEYHDCQRFLVKQADGTLAFDSLQAVFVRYQLDVVYTTKVVPVVPKVIGTTTTVAVPATFGSTFRNDPTAILTTVAETYSEGKYAPLYLDRGFNCVVLKWNAAAAPPPEAYVVPVSDESKCLDPYSLPINLNAKLSVVQYGPIGDAGGTDQIPVVSRWDWSPTDSTYVIGLLCPNGKWCELHGTTPAGRTYASLASYSAPADLSGVDRSVVREKGFYDEQYLARGSFWSHYFGIGPRFVRDGTLGTVFPVPNLATRTLAHYQSVKPESLWIPVAWTSLNVASATYKQNYNYDLSPAPSVPGSRNDIALCFGDVSKCGKLVVPNNCDYDSVSVGTWFARVTSPTGPTKYFCVKARVLPSGVTPGGFVRWRWSVKDETIWIPCPVGCCEVDPDRGT